MKQYKGFRKPFNKAILPPLIDPFGRGGRLNMSCFNFTGSNYALLNVLSGFDITQGFTFSAWVKPNVVPEPNVASRPIMALYKDAPNFLAIRYPIKNTSNVNYEEQVTNLYATSNKAIPNSDWQFFAFSRVGTNLTWWINGVKTSGTIRDISTFVGIPAFQLGLYGSGFLGKMAGVSIINSGISDAQEAFLRANGNPTEITGCKAWYPYPNSLGDARDYSGNNNHLTTTGGTMLATSGGPGLPYLPDTSGNLGPELVQASWYTATTGWTLSNTSISGGYIVFGGAASQYASRVPLTAGRQYRITLYAELSAGLVKVEVSGGAASASISSGTVTVDLTPATLGTVRVEGVGATPAVGNAKITSIREIL